LVAEIVQSERRQLAVLQGELASSPRPCLPSSLELPAQQSA
jgi:hypothetical protein